MNGVVSSILLVLPILLAFLIPLAGATWIVVGSRKIMWWVLAYWMCIFYFPNASWGLVDQASESSFYNRGTGFFFFSAINLLLFGLGLQALAAQAWARPLKVQHNLGRPALIFWLILIGNVLIGSFIDQVRWFEIIGYAGLLNVANFMLAFFALTRCLNKPGDLDRLIDVMLLCAVTRGLWGAFRFLAMGGDPANFYANFQKIDVKLTFFDINDALIATLALFVSAWRLTSQPELSRLWRSIYSGVVALELFIIVFSYRRTAWAGLAVAALLFAYCQPKKLRYPLYVGYGAVGLPALIYKMTQRSGQELQGASLLERLLPDVTRGGGELSFTTGRFAELYAAFLSFKESPLFGLGTWGRYDGLRFSELAWHRGDFGWMHSGLLHIALKSGLVGAAISVWVVVALIKHVQRVKDAMPSAQLGILMAGLAGVLFMLPNWMIGTPVIEYRTMQLMAFTFALPYLAYAASPRNVS